MRVVIRKLKFEKSFKYVKFIRLVGNEGCRVLGSSSRCRDIRWVYFGFREEEFEVIGGEDER